MSDLIEKYQLITKKVNDDTKKNQEKIISSRQYFKKVKDQKERQDNLYELYMSKQNLNLKTKELLTQTKKYNDEIMNLEQQKEEYRISFLERKIKQNNAYLQRCKIYLDYLDARIKKRGIDKNTLFYKLMNFIQGEILFKLESEEQEQLKVIKINKKSDEIISFYQVEENESTKKIIIKEEDFKTKIESLKEVFRNKKLVIQDDTIKKNIMLEFDIEEVIDLIYGIKEQHEIQHK